jgi:hypothetical protein
VKFVRLLRKVHGGQIRLYAQVVCAEQPLEGGAGDATGGWDLGVSTSAWVGDSCTALEPFAPGLADFRRRDRRLQRQVDRQRRRANPENSLPDGTIRPGRKIWMVSGRQTRVERRLAATVVYGRQAAQRRNENGRLAKRIVAAGRHIRTEDVPVRLMSRSTRGLAALVPPWRFPASADLADWASHHAMSSNGSVADQDSRAWSTWRVVLSSLMPSFRPPSVGFAIFSGTAHHYALRISLGRVGPYHRRAAIGARGRSRQLTKWGVFHLAEGVFDLRLAAVCVFLARGPPPPQE